MTQPLVLPDRVGVVNVGLPLFGDAIREQGAPVVSVDWRGAGGGGARPGGAPGPGGGGHRAAGAGPPRGGPPSPGARGRGGPCGRRPCCTAGRPSATPTPPTRCAGRCG